jgi:hypothetical protein
VQRDQRRSRRPRSKLKTREVVQSQRPQGSRQKLARRDPALAAERFSLRDHHFQRLIPTPVESVKDAPRAGRLILRNLQVKNAYQSTRSRA